MRDEILAQMKAALPLDGVLLGLHGAMVAHGYDDVEGDLLSRARAIVGPKCVIGVELDPHCHLTMKRVSKADMKALSHMYRAAWHSGLNTTYYLRTLQASIIEKATVAVK